MPTATVLSVLAAAAEGLGDVEAAERYHQSCIERYPTYTTCRVNYAVLLSKQDRFSEEREQYVQVLEYEPGNFNAALYAAYSLIAQKDYSRAESYLRRAIAIQPDADAYFWLGRTLLNQGKDKQAVKALEQALAINPGNTEAQDMLARLKKRS